MAILRNTKRHILVAVSGNTPQIVTETLWHLRIREKVPIEAVYILTTIKGKEVAARKLGGHEGAIARFCREYGVVPGTLEFTDEHIIVLGDRHQQPLDDIRSTEDNRVLQRHLFSFIKTLTDDDNLVLHCSIGGGRRTMSAHMLLAMTIYGREDDRLSHVLVRAEFESNGDFFFPPKKSEPIAVRDAAGQLRVMQTAQHGIQLADIPIVRLGALLGEESETFRTVESLFRHLQTRIDATPFAGNREPKLTVDLAKGIITFNRERITLEPLAASILAYYAERKVAKCTNNAISACVDDCGCYEKLTAFDGPRLVEIYRRFASGMRGVNAGAGAKWAWLTGTTRELRQKKTERLLSEISKLKRLTRPFAPQLEIDMVKQRSACYAIRLEPSEIRIVPPSTKS